MKLKLGNTTVEVKPIDVNLDANELKGLRESTGLSMRDFARLCKVSLSTICLWEGGRRKPGRKSKVKLLRIIRNVSQGQDSKVTVAGRIP